jgi:hypothetical protein
MTVLFQRLTEAVYFVCEKASAHPERLDQIKLNKILWYADASAYLRRGESITGEVYIKKPFGPVARHNRIAVNQLETAGVLRRGRAASGSGHWNTHFDMTGDFEITLLSDDDRETIDRVYTSIVDGGVTSMDISARTHGEIWQLAERDEELPLYTVFAEKLGEVTEDHMERACESIRC